MDKNLRTLVVFPMFWISPWLLTINGFCCLNHMFNKSSMSYDIPSMAILGDRLSLDLSEELSCGTAYMERCVLEQDDI